MILPYWNSELRVEITSWFPWGKDYQPVSVNRFHDGTLKSIAASCLDLEGEFFFMASPLVGSVGSLSRDKFFHYGPEVFLSLGFLMMLGYSEKLEKAVIVSFANKEVSKGLCAGVTTCSLWRGGVFESNMKVIVLASYEPFYDASDYLKSLAVLLKDVKNILHASELSYYAEKFGYDRFFLQWENEDPYRIRVSQILAEIENEGVQEIVGGSPKIDFPPFFGVTLTAVENNL